MSRKMENQGFICSNCGELVYPLENGSYRNHCPCCLFSLHVDCTPGDKASQCRGLMQPVAVHHHSKKGYQILHKCLKCGFARFNIIVENGSQPDNFDRILQLMQQPAKQYQ